MKRSLSSLSLSLSQSGSLLACSSHANCLIIHYNKYCLQHLRCFHFGSESSMPRQPADDKNSQEKHITQDDLQEMMKTMMEQTSALFSKKIEELEDKVSKMNLHAKNLTDPERNIQQDNQSNAGSVVPNGPPGGPSNYTTWTDDEIKEIVRPKYKDDDSQRKMDQTRIAQLRSEKRKLIPTLKDTADTKSTYLHWKEAVLNYFLFVSPSFHKWITTTVSRIDVESITSNPIDEEEYKFPTIPSSINLSMLDLVELAEIVTSTISADYKYLLDGVAPNDPVTAFGKIYIYFQPNTEDTRSTNLAEFFQTKLQDNHSIPQFASFVRRKAQEINLSQGSTVITEPMMIALVRNAIQNSPRKAAYAQALLASQHKKLNSFVTFLATRVNAELLPNTSSASANLARMRGGKAERSRRRNKDGDRRRKSRNRSQDEDDNLRNGTYVKYNDQEGNTQVAKRFNPSKKTNRPCWNVLDYGKCTISGCPFKHNFEIIDKSDSSSSTSTSLVLPHPTSSSSTDDAGVNAQANMSNASQFRSRSEGQLEGDGNSSSNDDEFYNSEFLNQKPFHSASAAIVQKGKSNDNLSTVVASTLFLLSPVLFSLSLIYTIIYMTVKTISTTYSKIYRTTKIFIYLIYSMLLTAMHTVHSACAVSHNSIHHTNNTLKHPVILDSGCTIHMSGDRDLFIDSTLREHKVPISLADSSKAIYSTHVGKICLNNHVINCLYVPGMSQTLLSLGQFLRQGCFAKTDSSGNMSIYKNHNNTTNYLSFYMNEDNLFHLLPEQVRENSP